MQVLKRVFWLLLVSGILVACGDNGAEEVELSGSLTLWGSASPRPDFSEDCSGTGEYSFVAGGADITITSGDQVNYEGKLAAGRGGESRECDLPFSGSLILADQYTIDISADGESISTTCSADDTVVSERGPLDDIAFLHLRITDTGMECRIPSYLADLHHQRGEYV